MTTTAIQKCRVLYKGKEREGHIIEQKMDKLKVFIDEEPHRGKQEWFEKREVKRNW